MTVSNFNMMSKGASTGQANVGDNKQHDFTYVVADEAQANFHAFFDEKETWINHRDNGKSLNIDAELATKLLGKGKA